MAKKLDELKGSLDIDKAFHDGYESEKLYNDAPRMTDRTVPVIEKLECKKIVLVDKETKTKRTHISLRPKLFEDITKIAFINKLSFNEQIARVLQEFRDNEQNKIKKYDEM